jgi:PAS domain-containing protein
LPTAQGRSDHSDCGHRLSLGELPDGKPSAGADGHITRPISDRDLVERLDLILRAQRAEAKLLQATRSLQQMMTQSLARDATERCRNQQLLAESHERFLHVVRATNDSVWDWDLVSNEVRWGDGFESVFGHPVNEIDPDSGFWYEHIHPDDRERGL